MLLGFIRAIALAVGALIMLTTAEGLETNKKGDAVLTAEKNIWNKMPLGLSESKLPDGQQHLEEFRVIPSHENSNNKETVTKLEAFLRPQSPHGKSRHRHREREGERERERMEANGRKERERERMRQRERERERAGQDGRLVKELEKETEGERQRQRLSPNGQLQEERERFRYRARGNEE